MADEPIGYKVMGIDPGSHVTGIAVIDDQGKLIDATLIKPSEKKDPFNIRVDDMLEDLEHEMGNWMPLHYAIEIPARHVAGNRQGQARYGYAVGAIVNCVNQWIRIFGDAHLRLYDAQEWTKGKKKSDRAAITAMQHKRYNIKKDPGYDVADAIQLAEICLKDIQIAARMPQSGKQPG